MLELLPLCSLGAQRTLSHSGKADELCGSHCFRHPADKHRELYHTSGFPVRRDPQALPIVRSNQRRALAKSRLLFLLQRVLHDLRGSEPLGGKANLPVYSDHVHGLLDLVRVHQIRCFQWCDEAPYPSFMRQKQCERVDGDARDFPLGGRILRWSS